MRSHVSVIGFCGTLFVVVIALFIGSSGNVGALEPAGNPVHAMQEIDVQISSEGTWTSFGSIRRGCDGSINAAVTMANGDLILGGNFSVCGGVLAQNLVRWDGARWYAVGGNGWSGEVRALAAFGSDLYVAGNGGAFSTAEGLVALRFARWDGAAWHSYAPDSSHQFNGLVNAIAVNGSELIVGGEFTGLDAGPPTLSHVARWSAGTWQPLGSASSNGVDGPVHAIAIIGNTIHVGGAFTNASGMAANRIASWNGSAWSSYGAGAQNGLDDTVWALAVNGADLVVGGAFQRAGGQLAGAIARWNGAQWLSLGSNPAGVTGTVRTLLVSGGQITVGGALSFAGSLPVNNIARWTGSTWTTLGGGVGDSSASSSDTLRALALWNGQTYAFGAFTQTANSVTNRAARWNGTAWQPLIDPTDTTVLTGEVDAMASNGTDLYVAGLISQVGNLAVSNIARWNGTSWAALGTGINGYVLALAIDGQSLYAGGSFSMAGGQVATNLARWDGTVWHAVGSASAEGTNGVVYSLAAGNGRLFVGGSFANAGGVSTSNIAEYSNGIWSGLTGGTDGEVYALSTDSNYLYAGGHFLGAGGVAANHIARWNGSQWSNLPIASDNGVNSTVYSLHRVDNRLYVGGQFSQAGPIPSMNVAIWNGVGWISPGGGVPDSGSIALGLNVLAGRLYAGTYYGAVYAWNGSNWSLIGTGSQAEIRALASLGTRLHVGGTFSRIGTVVSTGIVAFTPDRIFNAGFEGVLP